MWRLKASGRPRADAWTLVLGPDHEDGLEGRREGRGRISGGLQTLFSPLVALGKLINVPEPQCPCL